MFTVHVGALCHPGVLEYVEGESLSKSEGSLKSIRPQLDRGSSLEDQVLLQAGYGEAGQFSQIYLTHN